jgi:hypothetical protein
VCAERTFSIVQASSGKPFFSAFCKCYQWGFVTEQITLSDLDISSFLNVNDLITEPICRLGTWLYIKIMPYHSNLIFMMVYKAFNVLNI